MAWQFFTNSNPYALISMAASYYCLDIEVHAEFPGRVTISTREIVEGVVRDCDLVAKLKIAIFPPGVFVGDSRKFYPQENFLLYGMQKIANTNNPLCSTQFRGAK